jgi:hypothetical protein
LLIWQIQASCFVSGAGDYVIMSLDDENGFIKMKMFFTNVGARSYFVKDLNGCGVVQKKFLYWVFPNYFTPNGVLMIIGT